MDCRGKLKAKLSELQNEAVRSGIETKTWNNSVLKKSKFLNRYKRWFWYTVFTLVSALLAKLYFDSMDPRCIIGNNLFVLELARPAVSCDVCKNIAEVPTVDGNNFTQEQFLKNFAYNGVPLLVKGGARNWTALDTFNFDYLKKLFESTDGALESVQQDCQFFPYKTDFSTLANVFQMPESRSKFAPGEKQWYVGWSNCHPDVARELRKHYTRPPFLPDDSESSNIDWLFMGGFGGGADVHIDYVQRPSWQAMIAGKKSWKIVPSPECDSVCKTLNATMEKGDIILVDTNMWYHSTYIHPGEMSITIGSEYD